ncbi:cobyrinate a,c-diamide synthase [Desulfosporosinus sp. PR]|uniref:cobyrinate a,c-diamide synthase n=1 Tax=Candidatus Desulfosporosinus nitrosoreducens TaxID=3401928 RepID=UPI0027EC6CB8|nr:cobyrinate a,c-diamide synthase [Desulfosporosinus sp. PR]MDQ7094962.1 cobyrinate a,c-diamide synthase [Desulfosporosinus sp. PR]
MLPLSGNMSIMPESSNLNVPRLVIGAPQGRSGKTTFTLGLLRAFARQGLEVQPFKKGPDYIDTSWHSVAAGNTSRNLDAYFMNRQELCQSVLNHSKDKKLTIIEGAMGLYDGSDLKGSSSTAEIAKITRSPVLLVVDATRMTRSIAAMVMGYQHFDPEVQIVGVVLNKVAQNRHEKVAREAIEEFCKIPVVGAIPKDVNLTIPDRHLGLVTSGEINETDKLLDYFADVIADHVDLKLILELAQSAPELPYISEKSSFNCNVFKTKGIAPKIGVIRDAAFSFYYPENLEALQHLGANLVPIKALADDKLPDDLDGLYIGGGFPEIFAAELEKSRTIREEIRSYGEKGLPIYAECGGLMFLGRTIRTAAQTYEMVGLLPFDTQMEAKPQGHGYTLMQANEVQSWFAKNTEIKGHEFHNSRIINLPSDIKFGLLVKRGHGIDGQHDGICYKNVFASYNHLHALGCPVWAERMVHLAAQYNQTKWASIEKVAGQN